MRRTWPPPEGEEIPVSFLGLEQRQKTLWVATSPITQVEFPPCIVSILKGGAGKGAHRTAAILASFLGQAGWGEEEALNLWKGVPWPEEIKEDLFYKWFRSMHCPSCRTIQSTSPGYPRLGLGGLGHCRPDERCGLWPGDYADPEGRRKGEDLPLGQVEVARFFSWSSGREEELEIGPEERAELEGWMRDQPEDEPKGQLFLIRVRLKGTLRATFTLKPMEEPRRGMLSELI